MFQKNYYVNTFCIFVMITNAISAISTTTEKSPYFDGRDETISNTSSTKPLGLMCSGIATCQTMNNKHETTCFPISGNSVIISCYSSPWKNASAYCKSYGGHLMSINEVENQVIIRKRARKQTTCRKFWLYKKADLTVTETSQTTSRLTTIRVDMSISTDELLTVTTPTAELTTSSSGKSTLVIKITVPIGCIIIITLIIIFVIYKKKGRPAGNPNEQSDNREEEMEGLMQCDKNYISLKKTKLELLRSTITEICDEKTIAELKKTAVNNRYASILERVNSFRTWKFDVDLVEHLVKAGFFHKGKGDKVKCFSCDLGLQDWQASDIPYEEHNKKSKLCPYIEARKQVAKLQMKQDVTTPMNQQNNEPRSNNHLCMECHERITGCLFHPCEHACCCWECGKGLEKCGRCSKEIKTKTPFNLNTEETTETHVPNN